MSSSWFPFTFSLPNLSPPLSIQRRFISFILKRSLGHLLKPGQLDIAQIDAQIGNGFVEVKDLELDSVAINRLLEDFPVQLHSGTIATVTARIPWPNPFSSTIGLSMSGLHVVLATADHLNRRAGKEYSNELAESVASVAETFIHEELTKGEEALLRDSVQLEPPSSRPTGNHSRSGLPGSLDPFIDQEPEMNSTTDNDPEGVSIFASLFECLLARFDFDASDTKITLNHSNNAALTLNIARVRYFTETSMSGDTTGSDQTDVPVGETRSVHIQGVKFAMRDLSPPLFAPFSPSPAAWTSTKSTTFSATESSDSDLDDETQTMMSQSLVSLPPRHEQTSGRPPSPSLSTISSVSATSSMYQSAISTSRIPSRPSSPPEGANTPTMAPGMPEEQTILSISDPIVIRLTTPPPYVPSGTSSSPDSNPTDAAESGNKRRAGEKMKLDISLGVIAISLHARNVSGILGIANIFSSVSGTPQSSPNREQYVRESDLTILDRLVVSLHVKGVVALILGSSEYESTQQNDSSLSLFFSKPLVPPFIPCGYAPTMSSRTSLTHPHSYPHPYSRRFSASSSSLSASQSSNTAFTSCTILDISILAFHSAAPPLNTIGSPPNRNISSPILITDTNLTTSYYTNQPSSIHQEMHIFSHNHPSNDEGKQAALPTFDVIDWTSEINRSFNSSPRVWRTKPPHTSHSHHRRISGGRGVGFVSNVGLSSSPPLSFGSPKSPTTPPSPVRSAKGFPAANAPKSRNVAFSVKAHLGESNSKDLDIVVNTTPLHMFIGLEAATSVINFMNEALLSITDFSPDTEVPSPASDHGLVLSNDNDEHFNTSQMSDRERERRRLEKLVLDDLDLGIDYRQSGETTPPAAPLRPDPKVYRPTSRSKIRVEILVPLVRVEIRVPPPRNRQPRSGSLILDVHSARLSSYPLHPHDGHRASRFRAPIDEKMEFGEWLSDSKGKLAAFFEMRRVVVAYAGLGKSQAQSVLSLGPISDSGADTTRDSNDLPALLPLVMFRSLDPSPNTQTQSTAVLVNVPSLHVVADKIVLDGLQLWADDVSQWSERINGGQESGSSTRAGVSRNTSLIGSRYFVKRTGSGSTESELASTPSPGTVKSELVVKAILSEVFIRLVIPMDEDAGSSNNRHLDLCASDLDALVEIKPEGKEETVISLNIFDANITGSSPIGSHTVVSSSPLSVKRGKQAVLKFRFRSVCLPGTIAKESRVRLTLHGLRINLWSELEWIGDLSRFAKTPPGAFESVIPSERTQISVNILECALRVTPPSQTSALVLSLRDVGLSTDLVGDSQETALNASITAMSVLLTDDVESLSTDSNLHPESDAQYWMALGYALLASIEDLKVHLKQNTSTTPYDTRVGLNDMNLSVHLCADSISGVTAFISDLQTLFASEIDEQTPTVPKVPRRPTDVSEPQNSNLFHSLDEQAFLKQPVIGPLPDMISDDLPSNPEYLDASYGAAGGFRPLEDDDDNEFYHEESDLSTPSAGTIVDRHGGETIKMLYSPIDIIENYYDTLTPSSIDLASEHGDTSVRVRAQDCNVHLLLYEGYDWERTRRAIQEEVRRVKRRLAKIRQLLANGQTYDPSVDEVNSVLFNSVYVGLDHDVEELEPDALIAAIDEELDDNTEAASESSWQSFKPDTKTKPDRRKTMPRTKKLNRSKGPSIEFSLRGLTVDFDQYLPGANLASRLLFTIEDLEILDHIKTSTWSKFLTEMRSDTRGNVRETGSNMVRVELQMLLPYHGHLDQEARLKAKLLPLRLHVDQDALDFLKKFFSFKDADAAPSPPPENEIFFQHVEIFPIDIKLDYKPRRVDYRALKEGKTIELMNFFHFEGAEMTLRHLTLKGITGWPRMFDTLNDLWTPDVKANQLVDVISGVSPIRSAVNVGSGVADLILLPIAQYKKDGRIIRGLQKGTTAFVKSTAMEAIRLGARLATGTQVVLEQTETVLGGQFSGPVTAEALQVMPGGNDTIERSSGDENVDHEDLISRYAEQPTNIREGVQSAYKTLSQNVKSAGQTILAVPMEVYERSGDEGPARAVIRAVPIAILKPMIGASEAISKTLLGLHNTLDPQAQMDTEAKYKHR
ncbi:hypothetical protein DFH11DRAFT_1574221 [Phellopilus nigrolimitatus]|nr:hypothetical protein DFH11DRAFT_1574221 [Phellopilus nigrolimitatus]